MDISGPFYILLENDTNELGRKIYQLEILAEVKNFQSIIIEEEKVMPFILDKNKSIRYQEGVKAGLEKGLEKAARNLLRNTSYSVEEISKIIDLPKEFVQKIKMTVK